MSRARLLALALAASVGFACGGCSTEHGAGNQISSLRMLDGKEWTTNNLDVGVDGSYCYGNSELNCRRFGRLFTWEAARRACAPLGHGWRLPTDDEWRQLAKRYGGVLEDSEDGGKEAYTTLMSGGRSRFNALLGGNLVPGEGQYARLDEHGFYWSATQTGTDTAWFYNFGKGGQSLNRQREGNKQMAVSVRCVNE